MVLKIKLSNHIRKDGYKLIELYYSNQNEKVHLSTGIHVLEKFFDETAVMKISSKVQTHVEDNAKLADKEKRLKKIIVEWKRRMAEEFGEDFEEVDPPASYIKVMWKKPAKEFANEDDVKEVFHTWMDKSL